MSRTDELEVAEYGGGWRRYRRLQRIWFVTLFVGPFVAFGLAMPLNLVFASRVPNLLAALSCLALFTNFGRRLSRFPCPRCGQPFFYKGWAYNPLARACMHCGQPKG